VPLPAQARISILIVVLGLVRIRADVLSAGSEIAPGPFVKGGSQTLDTAGIPTVEIRRSSASADTAVSTGSVPAPIQPAASVTFSDEISVIPVRTLAVQPNGSVPARLGSDSAGSESNLALRLLLPSAAHVRNRIFDNAGVFVAALDCEVTDQMLQAGKSTADGRTPVTLQWNLRDMDGAPVPSGVYLWKLLVSPERGSPLETVQRVGVRPR
jgi:hypothetical protein